MKHPLIIYLFCLALIFQCQAYTPNPYVSDEVWEQLTPYFLPEDLPVKKALDKLFSKHRLTKSVKALRKAGFLRLSPKCKTITLRHYKIRGYVIKMYLDKTRTEDWPRWLKRIEGARLIQASIDRHGYNHLFKVPKKWIYPLPTCHSHSIGEQPKHFILVAQDMQPLFQHENWKRYKKKITPEILDAMFTIATENRLNDSLKPDNVAFCDDGKLAYLDTEVFQLPPGYDINYCKLFDFLSFDMRVYWRTVLEKHHIPIVK